MTLADAFLRTLSPDLLPRHNPGPIRTACVAFYFCGAWSHIAMAWRSGVRMVRLTERKLGGKCTVCHRLVSFDFLSCSFLSFTSSCFMLLFFHSKFFLFIHPFFIVDSLQFHWIPFTRHLPNIWLNIQHLKADAPENPGKLGCQILHVIKIEQRREIRLWSGWAGSFWGKCAVRIVFLHVVFLIRAS